MRKRACSRYRAALVSALLITTGFLTTLPEGVTTQSAGVAQNVRIVLGAVYLICFVGQFALLQWVYNLDKKKVEEIEATLGRSNIDLVGQDFED